MILLNTSSFLLTRSSQVVDTIIIKDPPCLDTGMFAVCDAGKSLLRMHNA